jgi:hypothetical protein
VMTAPDGDPTHDGSTPEKAAAIEVLRGTEEGLPVFRMFFKPQSATGGR